jgi:flagellar motor switch protein FliN
VTSEEKKEATKVDLAHLSNMPVQLSVVLGKCKMKLEEVLKIAPGSIVELDRSVNDLVEVFVNNKVIARGQVVIVEDKVGVTLKEIVTK